MIMKQTLERMSDKTKIRLMLMIGIVNNPRKYDQIINVPGAFDAAEFLYINHWEEVNAHTREKIEVILLKSGKYEYEKF